jgi:Family of unknown function (DUF6152)
MSKKTILLSMVTTALIVGAFAGVNSSAHHSVAMFDHTKKIVVEGTVKEWQWTNPHAWLQVMTPDASGAQVEQGFEIGSPNTLVRNGFKKDSFKPGDKVKAVAAPRRDGTGGGMYLCGRTAQGQWLVFGGPDATPPVECKD